MSDEAPTQPTLKSIMDVVNAIGIELHEFRASVEERLNQLDTEVRATRAEVSELRQEMGERFDDLDERMEVLAGDVIKARARSKRLSVKSRLDEAAEGEPEKKRA